MWLHEFVWKVAYGDYSSRWEAFRSPLATSCTMFTLSSQTVSYGATYLLGCLRMLTMYFIMAEMYYNLLLVYA